MLNIQEIMDPVKMVACGEELKKRCFKPGFDGMAGDGAMMWMQINGLRLQRDILENRYSPMPALGFVTAKKDGHYRQLAKLTAIDTVVQMCLNDALTEACESVFSKNSFAYRKGRGVAAALRQYCALGEEFAYAARTHYITRNL